MDPIICIDFGNSYTKVALRKKPDVHYSPGVFGMVPRTKRAKADPIRDGSLRYDDDSVAIPSAVAFTRHGNNPRYYCGSQVEQISPDIRNDPSTQVFRNWKPRFFGTPPAAVFQTAPVGAMTESCVR
jgi:molecular chaperone DnaK (HSP70)